MASGAHTLQQSRLTIEAKIKSLINTDLKEICRGENLAVSGVKAQLQTRILARTCYYKSFPLILLSLCQHPPRSV